MLLNQCLAISLWPVEASQSVQQSTGLRQSEALNTFRRLLDQNLNRDKSRNEANKTTNQQVVSAARSKELEEALRRVEFAGFVVPSWLLISGSYNDLHCVKRGWSDGQLRPPSGFSIETMGEYRRKASNRRPRREREPTESINWRIFGENCAFHEPGKAGDAQASPAQQSVSFASLDFHFPARREQLSLSEIQSRLSIRTISTGRR